MDFLNSIRDQYNVQTYNIATNNCNNFTSRLLEFLVSRPLEASILTLPQQVFSTPLGGMLRPLVDQLQNNIKANNGTATLDQIIASQTGARY